LITLAWAEYVASLVPPGVVAREDIDAVDRSYGQQPLPQSIANLDGVTGTGLSGDPVLSAVIVSRKDRATVAIDDGHLRETAEGAGFAGSGEASKEKNRDQAFHRDSVVEGLPD
jgi:hypothetical protein